MPIVIKIHNNCAVPNNYNKNIYHFFLIHSSIPMENKYKFQLNPFKNFHSFILRTKIRILSVVNLE